MSENDTGTIENTDPRFDYDPETRVRQVRNEYSRLAQRRGGCCGGAGEGRLAESEGYGYEQPELGALPQNADMGLGCGAPVAALDPQPGESVLDLGSGGGIDVFLAARRVGSTGRVIGVDMTPEMIELARENARKGGYDNVEFRQGRLESLPIEDASIDAVTSNCVINLVPDKQAVFEEIARVLRPGGRLVVSDVVVERALPEALVREMSAASCAPTAIGRESYLAMLQAAGLGQGTLLRDVDFLEASGQRAFDDLNEESRAALERAGVDFEELRGTVRSITVRALKT